MSKVKIGILGGGQLGQMMILAGYPLGLRFRVFDPEGHPPCHDIAEHVRGSYDDFEALKRFADGLDLITYEFENVDTKHLRALNEIVPIRPGVRTLEISQDRFLEKTFFADIGACTSRFQTIDHLDELRDAAERFGYPCILKTRRFGYDGKGQAVIHTPVDVQPAFEACGRRNLILESFVSFKRELSLLAARSTTGETCFYPMPENRHRGGILRASIAPAPNLPAARQAEARAIAAEAMRALDYVGVLTIEFFEVEDGLVVNEMAPRVHNSGHWTIEGSVASQFENHLRAIVGLPLGPCEVEKPSLMLNVVGQQPPLAELLAKAPKGLHPHYYGKTDRPGRKLAHLTYRADDYAALEECIKSLASYTDI